MWDDVIPACICEGGAERGILELLLEHNKLIFKWEDLLSGEIIRKRDAKSFQNEHLRMAFGKKIVLYRILDSLLKILAVFTQDNWFSELLNGKASKPDRGKEAMKRYNVKNLPLPILPGEKVFFVMDDNTVEVEKTTSVGINEEGRLLAVIDRKEYEIGTEDCVFLTEEDARRFISDPSSIPEDYGIVPDYEGLDLPYYPGTTFYYCEPDWFSGRWEIFEEYYTYVYFDADGSVRVGDEESECTVIGKDIDPCFDTLRKAQAYVRKNPM